MKRFEHAALIAKIPLFAGLSPKELERLADNLHPSEFEAGEIMIREGETDERFYILVEGEVEVIKAFGTPDERHLGVRPRGTLFGEMSIFDPHGRHTASVRTLSKVFTLEMTRQDFDRMLQHRPTLAYDMVRQMSRRLEETENATILDLREKNQLLTQAYQELKAAQQQLVIKERLEKELEIARQIQNSILPDTIPQMEGFDIAAITLPARAVGGDYYDFIPIDRHRCGLVIGDACDKGIPAALFINLTNSLVHIEAPRNPSPEATLQLVNQHLMDMSHSGMFVTMLYGILDISGRFDYCRAGHPYPLVLDANAELIESASHPGMALGITDNIELDAQTVTIPLGGMVVLFSDGLSEAMDDQDNQYGTDRLVKELATVNHLPASHICSSLWDKVKTFSGGQEQTDDFTVIVIKRYGGAG